MMFALRDLSLYSRMMLGTCVTLATVVTIEVILTSSGSNALADAGDAVSATATATELAALQIPPVVAYSEIRERPLFSDSRRPPQQAVQAKDSVRAVQLSTNWKVTGIAVAGDNSFVHLEGIRDRKTVRLQVGMPLDGWNLQEISPDQIVFGLGGESVTLRLHKDPAESAK